MGTIVGQIYLFSQPLKILKIHQFCHTHHGTPKQGDISYPLLKQLTAKRNFRARLGDKNGTTLLRIVLPKGHSFVITDFWGTIKKVITDELK